uniref:Uncharacterized protein n=1 Tax=Rhizophora mucronata TaxID=61149 RepID=A0A2P2IHG4_RHIMU
MGKSWDSALGLVWVARRGSFSIY